MKQVHFYWLDLIRFLSALIVVLCHFRGAFLPEYSDLSAEAKTPLVFAFYSITRIGHEAVLVFFAMSGFLVGGGRNRENPSRNIRSEKL